MGTVSSINFFTELLNDKNKKLILVLDYEKFNVEIENFSPNHKNKKIFTLFKIFKKDFSIYPKELQIKLKVFLSDIFKKILLV